MLIKAEKQETGFRIQESGFRETTSRVTGAGGGGSRPRAGARSQVSGARRAGFRFQLSGARSAVAWEYYAARLPTGYPPPGPAPENVSRGTKSPQRGRLHTESSGSLGSGCYFSTLDFRPAAQSRLLATGRLLDFEKLNEQSRNVYENKGPLWKIRRRSWNVYENTGT